MTVIIDGGAGVTFPDAVQQTNGVTMTGGAPKYYAARAWVSFDGTGTVAIRAAANVSSITDVGTGEYTINFASAMPDVNYVVSYAACNVGINAPTSLYFRSTSIATNSIGAVILVGSSFSAGDPAFFHVSVFR